MLERLRRHHPASYAHSFRVTHWTMAMWRAAPAWLGCGATALLGSALHDVGKLYVPVRSLASREPLATDERRLVQAHAAAGGALLAARRFPRAIIDVAAHHHERWDGGGYPSGQAATSLAPIVRAVAAADAFTAMTEPGRSYRTPFSQEAALRELEACRGRQFDPQAVATLILAVTEEAAPAPMEALPHGRRAGFLRRVCLAACGRELMPAAF
nr:HD domain-containing phosphohydrolase [Roseococcus sp. SDR]